MTDPANSTPEAVRAIESRFPAAALAHLEFEGDWSEIDAGSLVSVRMPGSFSRCATASPSAHLVQAVDILGRDTPTVTNS